MFPVPADRTVSLVDLLLLVDGELARAAVDEEQEAAHDGKDLEEIVLGKVLVRMPVMELDAHKLVQPPTRTGKGPDLRSRSC